MDELAIESVNLTKIFYPTKNINQLIVNLLGKSSPVLAVNNVSLQIRRGELFVLMGPNGAGKTTLIKMFAGLILPTSGTVMVNGYDIVKDDMQVKSSIGLLTSEERSFYWRLTGRENLFFFATLYGLFGEKLENRVDYLAGLLQIKSLDTRFQEYSAGMKQRLAIARSLLNDPQAIFMDEPMKNLDPLAAESLRNFIKNELIGKQKKTILFCTHNLNEAAALGTCIAIMDKGIIKACGDLEGLRRKAGLSGTADINEVFKHYVDN